MLPSRKRTIPLYKLCNVIYSMPEVEDYLTSLFGVCGAPSNEQLSTQICHEHIHMTHFTHVTYHTFAMTH